MRYLGVDPGKDGGMVTLSEDGKVLEKLKTPLIKSAKAKDEYDIQEIARIFSEAPNPKVVILEKGQVMPMSGASAQFYRGFSFGMFQGLLVGMKISYHVVSPRTWQKVMFADVSGDDTKAASVLVAKRLWPEVDWRKSERARNADDGLTDAALIAMWGIRTIAPASKVF